MAVAECSGYVLHTYQLDEFGLDFKEAKRMAYQPPCLASDLESVHSLCNTWEKFIAQKLSLACFTEEHGEPKDLVGVNIIMINSKGDPVEDFSKVRGRLWRKCLKTLMCAEKMVDAYDYFGVDKYLTTYGLTVLPEHRGQNIGARFMEARAEICKAFDIKAVCIVFTAVSSQVLAAKCNYRVLATLKYSDMIKQGVDLTRCTTKEAKVMGIKYN